MCLLKPRRCSARAAFRHTDQHLAGGPLRAAVILAVRRVDLNIPLCFLVSTDLNHRYPHPSRDAASSRHVPCQLPQLIQPVRLLSTTASLYLSRTAAFKFKPSLNALFSVEQDVT